MSTVSFLIGEKTNGIRLISPNSFPAKKDEYRVSGKRSNKF